MTFSTVSDDDGAAECGPQWRDSSLIGSACVRSLSPSSSAASLRDDPPVRCGGADEDEAEVQADGYGETSRKPRNDRSSPGRPALPPKLYDRTSEANLLLECLDRCCASQSPLTRASAAVPSPAQARKELILLTGPSGTGKTCLVESSLRPALEHRGGAFAAGKFDLLERREPHRALAQALTQYAAWAQNDAAQLHHIQAALEHHRETLQALLDLVPALSYLLPPEGEERATAADKPRRAASASAAKPPGASSRERLQCALRLFLQSVCSPTNPLVLFWDDLQWADPASLDTLAFLLQASSSSSSRDADAASLAGAIPGLLLVGACRDTELDAHAHLSVLLRELEANDVQIVQIALDNLPVQAVTEMIQARWNLRPQQEAERLGATVHRQTSGNPFYAAQVLQALEDEGLMYRTSNGSWAVVSDEEIGASAIGRAANVRDLVASNIQKQIPDVQDTLVAAACLGAEFSERLLEEAVQRDVTHALHVARTRGFLRPAHSVWEDDPGDGGGGAQVATTTTWTFVHDQIQQSAYSLVPPHERPHVHLGIGRTLWRSLTASELDEHANVVVKQLRLGASLLTDPNEREQMAALLLRAGELASQSAAHLTAQEHIGLGMSLLERRHWRDQYQLSLGLYNAAAEVEYCVGNFSRMDELVQEVLRNARCTKDKVRAQTAQIYSLGSRNQLQEAIDVGLATLKVNFGEKFPSKPSMINVLAELVKTKRMLRRFSDDALMRLPIMDDHDRLAAQRIMCLLFAYTLNGRPMFAPLIAMRLVQHSLLHGISGMSSVSFSAYAMLLCIAFQDVDLGIRYGRVALKMQEAFDAKEWLPRVYSAVFGFCFTYKEPLQDQLKPLLFSHRVGLGGGDIEFSMLSAAAYTSLSIFSSVRLSQLSVDVQAFLSLTCVYHQSNMAQFLRPNLQFIHNMRGNCKDPTILSGDALDLDRAVQDATQTKNTTIMSIILLFKLLVSSYFGKYEYAEASSRLLSKYGIDSFTGFCKAAVWLHEGLAVLSLSGSHRRRRLRLAKQNLKRLERLGAYSNSNFGSKASLLSAEVAVVEGKFHQALLQYEKAINLAEEARNWSDVALAAERCAAAFQRRGRTDDAKRFLDQAANAYELWGATAKVATIRAAAQQECAPDSMICSGRRVT